MIFDSHAHYDDEQFDEDREVLLSGMEEAGIGGIINMGASLEGVAASQALAEQYPFIYAAAGVHPDHVGSLNEEKMQWLYELCKKPKTVAVGEIGLDYYWDKESHDCQKEWFIAQLNMAKENGLPVNIHSRDAAQETFEIMKKEHAGTTGGVIHCFSSSAQMALEYVKLGYSIGIGGVVTFKNGRKCKETVEMLPMDKIILETDAPYLAPEPFRGRRNNSAYLSYVAEKIAEIKGISKQEVIEKTSHNACTLYKKLV